MTGLCLILDQMLPGDAGRNLPSFDMLGVDLEHHFTRAEFDLADDLAGPDKPITDINELLKLVRADHPDFAQKLADKALTLYFTHATVTAALQHGRSTLFPYERSLAAIDYDLLEPVYETNRGSFP